MTADHPELIFTACLIDSNNRPSSLSGVNFQLMSLDPNRQHRKAGENSLAEVKLGENEALESALRRFKRKVQQEDIIREVKRHAFYVPPGEKRRLKSALARKRNRRKFRRPAPSE